MKVNILKAIREYDDIYGDTLRIAEEMEHCFKQYEHNARRVDREDQALIAEQIEICWGMHNVANEPEEIVESVEIMEHVVAKVTTVVVKPAKEPVVRNRAYKRKHEARAKRQMRRTALIVSRNIVSRDYEDMYNWRFCKKRDGSGDKVYNPKSRAVRAGKVWARAKKQKLVTGRIGDYC